MSALTHLYTHREIALGGWIGAVYETAGADADGARGLIELPEGEGAAGGDADPDHDQDGCGVFRG